MPKKTKKIVFYPDVKFKWEKSDKPIFNTDDDFSYALLTGQFSPEELLTDASQIDDVKAACALIKRFLEEAEAEGLLGHG